MSATEWSLLLAMAGLWAGSFLFNALALRELGVLSVVALRVATGAVMLWVGCRALGVPIPTEARLWAAFATMGLLNNVAPFTLIVWGQQSVASGVASILNATTPLFAVLVAHVMTRDEKLTPARLAGLALGLSGVAAIAGPAAAGVGDDLAGQAACLGAALSYALAGVYGRRFARQGVAPMAVAFGMTATATVALAPLALLIEQPWRGAAPGWLTWAAVLALGALSTALAYRLYFRLLATAGATNLALVTFLIPIGAILLGMALLGEALQARHGVGMALIGAGLAAIDGRPLGLLRRFIR